FTLWAITYSFIFIASIIGFIYASHNVWYFGKEFCRFQNLFPITALFVSIYFMTAVAADRYVAIIYPLKPKLSAGNTRVIRIIWLVAFGLAFPIKHQLIDVINMKMSPFFFYGYHIAVIMLIYLLIIEITLWSSTVPGNHTSRVYYHFLLFVRTMVTVVITVAVCWLPYHLYFIFGIFKEDMYKQQYIQQVHLAVFLAAMSSTTYNPIIYCCLNQTLGFRLAFHGFLSIQASEKDELKLIHPLPLQLFHKSK
uniref:Tachykinin receptor 2 n=1 Tax=Crocodylus porosus TaxID=8502 RepID=A0A7M4EHQ8_CROPO